MASELLKNRALIQRLKEPEVPKVNFDLASTGFEELFTLPEPKPQELLDIQENVRIQRQQDTMNKARPFLMNESVDFIERQGFKYGTFGNVVFREDRRLPYAARIRLAPGQSFTVDDITYEGSDKTRPSGQKRDISKAFKTEKQARDFLKKAEKALLGGKTILPAKDLTKKFKEYKKKYPDRILDEEFTDLINKKHVDSYRNPFSTDQIRQEINRVSGGKLKGAGVAFEKLPKSKQNELINRFPEIYKKGYNFDTHRLGVTNAQAGNLYNEIYNAALDFSKRWPSGGENNKNKIWHAAYRSVVTGENLDKPKYKLFDVKKNRTLTPREIEKTNWAKKFKQAVFLDTETGKKFSYDGKVKGTTSLENYINKFSVPGNPDPNRFKNAVSKYELTQKIRGIKITTRDGKKMTLGGYLDNQTRPAWMKKGSPYGFLNNHHIFDITKNFWDTEPVLYKDNRNLNYFERPARDALIKAADLPEKEQTKILKPFVKKFKKLGPIQMKEGKLNLGEYDFNKVITSALDESDLPLSVIKDIKKKELSALQQLMQGGKNVGADPSLLMKAGYEEFVKPTGKFAGQVARGAGTAADLLVSAGPGAKGLGVGLLLEADPIITGMSEGKSFGQTARDTFIGSAIDAIPGVNLGSLNEDLIKLADTEEQRVGIQNLIDYQKDYDRFLKDLRAFKSYQNLDQTALDELGFTASDLVNMESSLAERFKDIQTRAPKVYNPDVLSLVRDVARKEAEKRKENLEGIQGLIFGDRMAKDPNFIENQIQQILAASTGAQGATDSYADAYKFLPQEQLTSDELDERFDMEGGIMAANGGRIGFADGPTDPKRRTFMKIMAGIASLPIFSKFIGKSEVAKPIVKVAGSSTKMPDWFPDLINKVMFGGTGKKVDADLTVYEPKELPGISIGRYDDGRVFVEGENEYGKKYMIEYEPPGYELIDEKTGKAVKKKGEFIAQEEVPVNVDPDGNADFDVEVLDDLDQILGPDTRAMEEFATGKPVKEMKSGEFSLGRAEAEADVARDMDDYYED